MFYDLGSGPTRGPVRLQAGLTLLPSSPLSSSSRSSPSPVPANPRGGRGVPLSAGSGFGLEPSREQSERILFTYS